MDPSAFYNSPELADVNIVLVEEQELTPNGHFGDEAAKGLQQYASAEEQAHQHQRQAHQEQQQQQQQQQEQRTLRLHGHKFLLSASSSVLKTRIVGWSVGDGNALTLQVC
jgi:transcription initiation factor TFIID subunit TAF12